MIQNQNRTYRELLGLVLEPYHAFSDGGACLDAPFPSLLVQDQETDWEFVKRLASQIGREVFLNSASEQVQIFVGLTGEEDELTDARFWKKCYQPESGKEILYIKTRKRYHPGCRLYFQGERHAVKNMRQPPGSGGSGLLPVAGKGKRWGMYPDFFGIPGSPVIDNIERRIHQLCAVK